MTYLLTYRIVVNLIEFYVIKYISGRQGAKVRPFPLTLQVVLTTVLRYRVHCDMEG